MIDFTCDRFNTFVNNYNINNGANWVPYIQPMLGGKCLASDFSSKAKADKTLIEVIDVLNCSLEKKEIGSLFKVIDGKMIYCVWILQEVADKALDELNIYSSFSKTDKLFKFLKIKWKLRNNVLIIPLYSKNDAHEVSDKIKSLTQGVLLPELINIVENPVTNSYEITISKRGFDNALTELYKTQDGKSG